MRVTVVLAFVLGFACPAIGDDKPGSKVRPPLTRSVVVWLEDGFKSGKLSEDDIVSKLGRPDRIGIDLDRPEADAITKYTYLDINRIEVEYKDGKVVRVGGEFSAAAPHKNLNLDTLRALKKDMQRDAVSKLIGRGAPTKEERGEGGIFREVWSSEARITVSFQHGKYAGLLHNVPADSKK